MRHLLLLLLLSLLPIALPARAERSAAPIAPLAPALAARLSAPAESCRAAIAAAERAASIPAQLLAAIARVESGRYDPVGDRVAPWPWTINAEGTSRYFTTRDEAIAAVRALQGQGVNSIDIGCMQVNLLYHPTAFTSLEQGFDPVANAQYAARFLTQLRDQFGGWTEATARYHSGTPEHGVPYQAKVAAVWPEEQRFAASYQRAPALAQSGRIIAPELARSGTPLAGVAAPVRQVQARMLTPPPRRIVP